MFFNIIKNVKFGSPELFDSSVRFERIIFTVQIIVQLSVI